MQLGEVFRLAARLLAANRSRLVVLAAGSVAVALAASSISLASLVSLASVHQTVAAGWRGAYDILIRPADTQSVAFRDLQVVPGNYLGVPTRGISRSQWEAVRSIPGVEVAAPVASLGWMKQDDVSVGVQLVHPRPGDILRIDLETRVAGGSSITSTSFLALNATGSAPSLLVGAHDLAVAADKLYASVGTLPSAWGLVVGVDPDEEQALIGLHKYVSGDYLPQGVRRTQDPVYGQTAVAVPVLTAADAPLSGSVTVRVQRISGLDANAIAAAVALRNRPTDPSSEKELVQYVADLTAGGTTETSVAAERPLGALVQPLRADQIALGADGVLGPVHEGGGGSFANGRNALLVPRTAPYASNGRALTLPASGSWARQIAPAIKAIQPQGFTDSGAGFGGDDALYRPVSVVRPQLFRVEAIGRYDLSALSAFASAANYVPLGVYEDAPRRLIATPGGKRVDEILPSSLNPAGLNPLPPAGLTNLDTVEALRGPQFIDAIRVRVGSIQGYSPSALDKIQGVAAAIVQRTHLRVDVVAGSSPVDVPVDIPGRGTIAERWTTLGEAVRIESATAGFAGILLWAALGVVLLYLLTFGLFLVGEQANELSILRSIGWGRLPLTGVIAAQATMLGAASAILSAAVTGAIGAAMRIAVPWVALAGVAAAALILHVLAAGLVALIISRRRHGGQLSAAAADRPLMQSSGVLRFAMAQAGESRLRLIGVTVGLGVGVAICGVVLGLQLGLGGRLNLTVLGQVVRLQVGPYHLLAAAAALFAAGAMAVDAAVASVERRISTIGVLRAVGWRRREIRRLILAEVTAPAAFGGITAAVLISAVLLGAEAPVLEVISIALLSALVAMGVGAMAALPAADIAARVAPVLTLSAEGASNAVPGFTGRSALLSVGSFASVAVIGVLVWGLVAPAPLSPNVFVPPPSKPPLTATAQAVQRDISAITSHPDRRPGSQALNLTRGYLRDQLIAAGYSVKEISFIGARLDLRDSGGNPVSLDPISSLFTIAVAYDPSLLSGTQATFRGTSIHYVDGQARASPPCLNGLVIARVGEKVVDVANADLAARLQLRCLGTTKAVVAVTAPDAEWRSLPHLVSIVGLSRESHVVAEPKASSGAQRNAPWLVAPMDSTGPAATQSAAPAAAALEAARLAVSRGIAVRLAFVVIEDGEIASFLEYAAHNSPARAIILGPLGGVVPMALGTTSFPSVITDEQLRLGLLATVSADHNAASWLETAQSSRRTATSAQLLDALSSTGLTPSREAGQNIFGLAAGLDAASIAEIAVPDSDIAPVAGTEADLASQVDIARVGSLAEQLVAALRSEAK